MSDPTATTETSASTPAAAPSPAPTPAPAPAATPAAAPAPVDPNTAAAPTAAPAPATAPAPAATPATPPAAAPGAPEAYEFKAPEGVTLDEGMVKDFSGIAKELNLTQDQAQKIVDLQAAAQQKQADAFKEQVQGWRDAVQADKDFGGDKLPQTIADAQKAIDLMPAGVRDEVKQLLDSTGFGNHPAVVKGFAAIGKLVAPDGFVKGDAPPPVKPMFPNSNMTR